MKYDTLKHLTGGKGVSDLMGTQSTGVSDLMGTQRTGVSDLMGTRSTGVSDLMGTQRTGMFVYTHTGFIQWGRVGQY